VLRRGLFAEIDMWTHLTLLYMYIMTVAYNGQTGAACGVQACRPIARALLFGAVPKSN
jgi:hypothetical protein